MVEGSTEDFVATNGTDVVLTAGTGATTGQILEVIALTTFTLHGGKENYSATTAPVATNNSTEGYRVGSLWVDTTNDETYICVNDGSTNSNVAIWLAKASTGKAIAMAMVFG